MNRIGTMLAVLICATSLVAGETVNLTRTSGYYWGNGGEYTISYDGQSYQTFCLELTENVAPPHVYDAVWNDEAVRGGLNYGPVGDDGGDLLSPQTAYLYTQFLNGALAGYNYTTGWERGQSAWALQQVIWHLEDEMPIVWAPGSLQGGFYADAMACGWQTTGNIGVWNLYENGRYRQDMLGMSTVPVPGGILLCGLGTGLVGWFRRKW